MMTTRSLHRTDPSCPRGSRVASTAARWVSLGLVAVVVVALCIVTVGTLTGRLVVQTVPTGSMEPTIPRGSAIVVTPHAVKDVKVGDIIVFAAPETGVTTVHRVVEIIDGEQGPMFSTKGDANDGPDPWQLSVRGGNVHEVREVIPGVGVALSALSSPVARLLLAALGAILVLGVGLRQLLQHPEPSPASTAHSTWDQALIGLGGDTPSSPHVHHDGALDLLPSIAGTHKQLTQATWVAPSDIETDTRTEEQPPRRRRQPVGTGGAVFSVLAVVVGIAALHPLGTARASFTDAAVAAQPVGTVQVPTRSAVGCAWSSATTIAATWTTPVGGAPDQTQLLTASTPTATPTVAATAAAGVTSASTSPSPVTTVRYLSTRAVRGTWSSLTSPQLPTNTCAGSIVTFAGQGTAAFAGDGGQAAAASLRTPYQIAEAADGRVFIADAGNNRVRVVAANGTITTFLGGGSTTTCSYTGPAASVSLNAPRGVAVDTAGNVYIADTGNSCIRKVDPSGTVTRVAGGGATTTCTTASVAATTLQLSSPSGLALAPDGSLVVADTGRNCIRRITGATATLVAGGGTTTTCTATTLTATTVSLSAPIGVVVDPAGDVVVADTGRNCVRRVSGTSVTRVAGGGATTTCTASTTPAALSLAAPEGVDIAADGSIVVAEATRRCVRRITSTTVTPVALTGAAGSSGDNGPAVAALANTPSGVTILASGDVVVSDRSATAGSNDVRRVRLS